MDSAKENISQDRDSATRDAAEKGSDPSNSELFVALFARNQSAIFGYILSLLPKWSDAEDVLQQTSVVLWRKFDQFDLADPESDFARWACQIARFKVLNHLKKHGRDRHVFSEKLLDLMAAEGLDDVENLHEERLALADCLNKLQQRPRQLVRSCYGGTSTIKDVALRMGRTPNSIYKSLNRIRERLLQCIERALALGGES